MLGDSNTIIWMYLNTAPPGWKALSTGADMVLGIAGGSQSFNVNGGNPDSIATWTISGCSVDAHQLIASEMPSHTHNTIVNTGPAGAVPYLIDHGNPNALADGTQATSSAGGDGTHTHGFTVSGAWRPKASIGKLFQLDTA